MLVDILWGILFASFSIGLLSVGGLFVYEWAIDEIEAERKATIEEVRGMTVSMTIIDETDK